MKKIEMVKIAGGIIVSVGVGAIVGNAIKCTTPSHVGTIKKVCIGVGAFILTSMISDKAVQYTEVTISKAIKSIKGMVEKGELN